MNSQRKRKSSGTSEIEEKKSKKANTHQETGLESDIESLVESDQVFEVSDPHVLMDDFIKTQNAIFKILGQLDEKSEIKPHADNLISTHKINTESKESIVDSYEKLRNNLSDFLLINQWNFKNEQLEKSYVALQELNGRIFALIDKYEDLPLSKKIRLTLIDEMNKIGDYKHYRYLKDKNFTNVIATDLTKLRDTYPDSSRVKSLIQLYQLYVKEVRKEPRAMRETEGSLLIELFRKHLERKKNQHTIQTTTPKKNR